MSFTTKPYGKKIEKPWGYEILYTAPHSDRVGKILFVRAGRRLSLQYHDAKEETLCLVSGKAIIWLENEEGVVEHKPMELEVGYNVALMQKHRVEAVEDSLVIESSDQEKGNTFRLEDDYARGTETEDIRRQDDRGWHAQ
ncbi:MAG TPA: cupin [Candidatus Eisenbacteria bacterium]|jgi:mannose-6-phosphate isomerase-like protein (cupin superfamily)|nr:cupin [Candidatus Eisenbacteria bacterium]